MVKGNFTLSRSLCAYLLFTVVCSHHHMSEYMEVLQYKLAAVPLTFFSSNPKFQPKPY